MAKGYDLYMERKNIVSLFGKDLARRSKSKCELCGDSGVKLEVFELPPVPEEPCFETSIFICENCKGIIEKNNKLTENELRSISESVWSETLIIKACTISLLKKFETKYFWIQDFLESVYIEEETAEFINRIKL
ncbi:MAG: PhnA protein [Fusobacteriaceae bacterium]